MIQLAESDSWQARIAEPIVLSLWVAAWSLPCQAMMAMVVAWSNQHPDFPILVIDIEQHTKLTKQYQIQSLPTSILLIDAEVKERESGVISVEKLNQWINHYLGQT